MRLPDRARQIATQRNMKGRALARSAFDPHAAAVGVEDTFDDGKPESNATPVELAPLPEPFEQVRDPLRGDTTSRVQY